jgi:two-component system OmpR family sensor kinase
LTLTLSLVFVAIVLGFALIGSVAVPSLLLQRDTDRLEETADRVTASLRVSGGVTIGPGALQNFVAEGFGVALLSGDVVVGTWGLPSEDAETGLETPGTEQSLTERIDVRGLGLNYAADGTTSEVTTVVLSLRTASRDMTATLVVTVLVVIAVATTAALITAAALGVGRGLRPLAAMADHAELIADGDRTVRLPVDSAGDPAIARMAQTVNTAFDAQEDAENRMRAFIADASHELRTPLTAAHGWIELYLRGGLEDETQRDAAMVRVERQLQRLRELTDELSLLARTDAGRPLRSDPVDLGALVRDVVHDANIVHPGRSIDVGVEGRAVVLGDEPRLAQVLRNLVGNALQHTAAAVEVEVVAGDVRHVVRVRDTGAGIPSEALPHLFERFWRGDAARATSTGSGLGLAIVQALVSAHGGDIRVTSAPGMGTTFEVSLPVLSQPPAS